MEQTNKQRNKQKNRKRELKNMTAATIITTKNTQTYTQSRASYSLYHIFKKRYYLANDKLNKVEGI